MTGWVTYDDIEGLSYPIFLSFRNFLDQFKLFFEAFGYFSLCYREGISELNLRPT